MTITVTIKQTVVLIIVLTLITSALFLFLSPFPASAASFVPCGTEFRIENEVKIITNPCQPCHIFSLLQNILNFLWWDVSAPLTALFLALGGFFMVIPGFGGNVKLYDKGKKYITNALMGLVIVFFSWLAIDTIIKVIAGQELGRGTPALIPKNIGLSPGNLGPWNTIECNVAQPAPTSQAPTSQSVSGQNTAPWRPSPGDVGGTTCPTCVKLSVPAKPGSTCAGSASGQICLVDNTLNNRLIDLNSKIQDDGKFGYWRVTEAWPPTVVHQNPCHTNGTCVDANVLGNAAGNATDISYFIKKADASGLNAIYEVTTETRRQDLIKSGVPAKNIQTVEKITGEHFSVYKR